MMTGESSSAQLSAARALLEIEAVRFQPHSPIRFKSGILAPIYIDNRSLIFHPAAWQTIIRGFQTLIEQEALAFDVLAGVAVGGVPHTSALAYNLEKPSVFIRKESKAHGIGNLIEGGVVAGLRVLLVEDLVTTGGSSLKAVAALRAAGALVETVVAIVSYGLEEARQAFAECDVRLLTLTAFPAMLRVAREQGLLREDDAAIIDDWLADPHGWKAGQQ